MISKFKTFDDLILAYAGLFSQLNEVQCDMAPQIFNKLVDSAFKQYNTSLKLFYAENNHKQAIREMKLNSYLFAKGWRKKIKEKHDLRLSPQKKETLIKETSSPKGEISL